MNFSTETILKKLNIPALLPMQEDFFEASEKYEQLILQAPTGSGKTLAFLLPIFKDLANQNLDGYHLILSPSRELGSQVEHVLRAAGYGHLAASLLGGRPVKDELNKLIQKPKIIVATPGRLLDHCGKGNIQLDHLDSLTLDEYDKILEMGFEEELKKIFSRVKTCKRKVLVSATQGLKAPAYTGMERPALVKSEKQSRQDEQVQYFLIPCEDKDRAHALYHLLYGFDEQKSIVFFNHKEAVDRIAGFLEQRDFPSITLHGNLDAQERELAMLRFLSDAAPVLLCTDLMGRGMDIKDLENVIHYHLPQTEEQWTHRNGRAARMGASGQVYCFDHPVFKKEKIAIDFNELPKPPEPEQGLQWPWESLYFQGGKKQKLCKGDLAGFLFKNTQLSKDELGKIVVGEQQSLVSVQKGALSQSAIDDLSQRKIKGQKIRIKLM